MKTLSLVIRYIAVGIKGMIIVCFDPDSQKYSCNSIANCSFLYILHGGSHRNALGGLSSYSQSSICKAQSVLCILRSYSAICPEWFQTHKNFCWAGREP